MTLMFPRPCLTCGRLTRYGSRCPRHTLDKRALYGGDYPARARAHIAAYPICVRCGARNDLTADHVRPGDPTSPLQTLCRSCNSRKGDRAS